jgi:hypothetical protein
MENSPSDSFNELLDINLVFNNSSTETTSTSTETMSCSTTDAPFSSGETKVPLFVCFCRHCQGRTRHWLDLVFLHLYVQYGPMENDPSQIHHPIPWHQIFLFVELPNHQFILKRMRYVHCRLFKAIFYYLY